MGKLRITTEKFIERSRVVHGNRYDYSEARFTGINEKISIRCERHGIFVQRANSHLNGKGCPVCGGRMKLTHADFIRKASDVHGGFYDYSRVLYTSNKQPVEIVCPRHGSFFPTPGNHLKGTGCPWCAGKVRHRSQTFTEKAQSIHGVRYNYSDANYITNKTPVTVRCQIHGPFTIRPDNHFQGHGCPSCSHIVSKLEQEVVSFIRGLTPHVITRDRTIIAPYELDIVIPDQKLALEVCGLYWHSEKGGHKPSTYHQSKFHFCMEKDYRLITIFEDEWINSRPIVESMIRHRFGLSGCAVSARKCKIEEITKSKAQQFLSRNHLHGYLGSTIRYGAYSHDDLIGVMTFSRSRFSKSYEWELSRFALAENTTSAGLANRLFRRFVSDHEPRNVVAYADLRYGTGQVYGKLGFAHSHDSVPNYWYLEPANITRSSRLRFQRHKIASRSDTKTEWKLMQDRGYDRIWDCGNRVWVWTV